MTPAWPYQAKNPVRRRPSRPRRRPTTRVPPAAQYPEPLYERLWADRAARRVGLPRFDFELPSLAAYDFTRYRLLLP